MPAISRKSHAKGPGSLVQLHDGFIRSNRGEHAKGVPPLCSCHASGRMMHAKGSNAPVWLHYGPVPNTAVSTPGIFLRRCHAKGRMSHAKGKYPCAAARRSALMNRGEHAWELP